MTLTVYLFLSLDVFPGLLFRRMVFYDLRFTLLPNCLGVTLLLLSCLCLNLRPVAPQRRIPRLVIALFG